MHFIYYLVVLIQNVTEILIVLSYGILVVSWKQRVKYKSKLVLGYSQNFYDSLR